MSSWFKARVVIAQAAWMHGRLQAWRRLLMLGLVVGAVVAAVRVYPPAPGLPWLMASLGASAILVCMVPTSPLARPWAVVGGNTVSAWVGWACAHGLDGPVPWVAAAAVVGATLAMRGLRCLHPPGGAVALVAVMGPVHDWTYVLNPVAWHSLALLLVVSVVRPVLGAVDRVTVTAGRCGAWMTPCALTVSVDAPLHEARSLLDRSTQSLLPVTNASGRVVGLLSRADLERALKKS